MTSLLQTFTVLWGPSKVFSGQHSLHPVDLTSLQGGVLSGLAG